MIGTTLSLFLYGELFVLAKLQVTECESKENHVKPQTFSKERNHILCY